MKNSLKHNSAEVLEGRKKDLREICETLKELKINCLLIDGVLLGAVRDKAFIKWDWDVELAVFEEEVLTNLTRILEALSKKGFDIELVNPISAILKVNVKKRGTKFSLVGLKKSQHWRYRLNYRYPVSHFEKLEKINFLGDFYKIPSDVNGLLSFCYGDWQTVKKERDPQKYLSPKLFIPWPINFLLRVKIQTELAFRSLVLKTISLIAKSIPKYREYFFSGTMLEHALKEDCYFLEIGSSDGKEMLRALKITKGKINALILEPIKENLDAAKRTLIKSKYKSAVETKQIAVSNEDGVSDVFYYSDKPNLSKINGKSKGAEIRSVRSLSVSTILSSFIKDRAKHLAIKMDIEGDEAKILSSSADTFKKYLTISILIEVHPENYHGDEMFVTLKKLFEQGFKVKMLETAWVQAPEKIHQRLGRPIKTFLNKGLYHDVPNDLALEIISFKTLNASYLKPFFTTKITRSILLTKDTQGSH